MPQAPQIPKILVIDDNAENRALAAATLEDEGYSVILAASGSEGIREYEKQAPDCVLLDVRMPGMDGFEVCAKLRSLPGGPEIPIIFLTALRDIDTFEGALGAGGDDFLTKPFRPAELTSRVQAALKLKRMGAELREHYELVRHQRDDLMRLQLQKERLMMFVVHDLKNPVNSIDLRAQMLARRRDMPDAARESAKLIRDEVRSLMLLILNLLDISKGEEGRLVPHVVSVDLEALMTVLFESLGVRARAKHIALSSNLQSCKVQADADLLRRVLENLIENAIRYAPEDSEVSVSAERHAEQVEVRVIDRGAGVPANLRDKIFERFVQVETEGIARTGRGLGLPFCKMAVEAHGGRIWVEDAQPGTAFCMTLPHGD